MGNIPIGKFAELEKSQLVEVATKGATDAIRYARESGDRRVEARKLRTRAEQAEAALLALTDAVLGRLGDPTKTEGP